MLPARAPLNSKVPPSAQRRDATRPSIAREQRPPSARRGEVVAHRGHPGRA